MSYILDALRKSEQDRELGRIPTLNSLNQFASTSSRGMSPWMVATVLLSILLIGSIAYDWQEKTTQAPEKQIQVFAAKPGEALAQDRVTVQATPVVRQTQSTVPVVPPEPLANPSVGAATRFDDILAVEAHEQAREERYRGPVSESVERKADRGVENNKPVVSTRTEAVIENTTDDPNSMVALVEENRGTQDNGTTAESVVLEPQKIPLLLETDLSFQQGVPDFSIDVHVYSENREERFVFINMRKYNEGDRTREGALVDAIAREGVVLDFQGTRFRLLAN